MNNTYLQHHGILGQKWGVRRYQNPDGSWTVAGRARYGSRAEKKQKYAEMRSARSASQDRYMKELTSRYETDEFRKAKADLKAYEDEYKKRTGNDVPDDDYIDEEHLNLMSRYEDLMPYVPAKVTKKEVYDKADAELRKKFGTVMADDFIRHEKNVATGVAVVAGAASVGYMAALVSHPVITTSATFGALYVGGLAVAKTTNTDEKRRAAK